MGTRANTIFINDDGKEICVLYRQYDGYKDMHGRQLKEFLKGKKIINGFQSKLQKDFNGMSCLAAQVIAYFKKEIGDFYIYPPGTRNGSYYYTIKNDNGRIKLIIEDYDDVVIDEWYAIEVS